MMSMLQTNTCRVVAEIARYDDSRLLNVSHQMGLLNSFFILYHIVQWKDDDRLMEVVGVVFKVTPSIYALPKYFGKRDGGTHKVRYKVVDKLPQRCRLTTCGIHVPPLVEASHLIVQYLFLLSALIILLTPMLPVVALLDPRHPTEHNAVQICSRCVRKYNP